MRWRTGTRAAIDSASLLQDGIGDHQRAVGVRDQPFERAGREPRVEQKRNGAGAHRAEEELDELHPVADQHGDALARADAEPRQHRRHAIHALVELAVGGCALAPAEQVDDRDLVRKPPDRCIEEKPEIAAAVRARVVHHHSCRKRIPYAFRFWRMPMRSSRGSTSAQKYGSSLR